MKKQKAFSLIELSIVILIIGILIAGITQSSRLVRESRLKSARSASKSAPVISTKGLLLWFDSTAETSFLDAEAEDGLQLSRWNDVNPVSLIGGKYVATKTASAHALYEMDGIGGVPSVKFSGATGANAVAFFTVASTITTFPVIIFNSNSYTAFIVYQLDSAITAADLNQRFLVMNGNSCCRGFSYARDGASAGVREVLHGGSTNLLSATAMTNRPEIASITYPGNAGGATTLTLYVNGVQEISASAGHSAPPDANNLLTIGGADGIVNPWQGFISELIIFEGAVNSADRVAIEKYLAKKYAIKIQ